MRTKDRGAPAASATLSVRVVPRSSKNAVAGIDGGIVRIRLTAPPVDGKANEALVEFLSDALDLPKRSIDIVSGETGRTKIVRVDGIETDVAIARLAALLI